MKTEQFNIRLPMDLIKDLNIISKLLKVNKSEWVKTKLAEDVCEEKNRLLMEVSTLYANGLISKKEVQSRVGKDIADQMESTLKIAKKSIEAGKKYGKAFREKNNI